MPVFRPLFLVLALLAATAAPLRSATPEAIAGAVLDAAGRPVAGAEVWLMTHTIPVEEWRRQLAAGPTTTTGPDGRFRLPRPAPIPEGTALYVCRPGLRPGSEPVLPDAAGPFLFRLEPAAVLAGRVLDPHGRPVADAGLFLSVPGEPWCGTTTADRRYPCSVTGSTSTGTDGRFVFDFLPPGWYEVAASSDGYLQTESPATRLKAGERADVELRLGAGAAVAGRVRTATGGPAAGVKVCTDNQCGVTAEDGSYRLAGVTPQAAVNVWAVDPDRGAAHQEVEIVVPETRVDLVLDGHPERHPVQGRLLGPDGAPLARRELTVWGRRPERTVTTGGDGSFELRLEPGTYSGSLRQQDGSLLATMPAFEVGDGPRRVELRPASGAIEGRVLGLAAGETAVVELPRDVRPWDNAVQVGPDGRYRFSGVYDGTWILTANAGGRVVQGQVDLSGGGTVRRDLVFEPAWEVSGRLLDHAGKPAPPTQIRFLRGDARFTALSGAGGSFARFLEAGDYRVEAWGEEGPIRPLFPLSIAPGGATGLELRLPPPVTLTGRVLGLAAGEQATLSVFSAGSVSEAVASGGRYRLIDVAPGSWSIRLKVRGLGLPYPAEASFSVPVEIPAGHPEVDVDVEVPRGPYSVTVAADGERVLWLRSADGELQAWTAAGRDGLFSFDRLPAGRYSVGTSMDLGGSEPEIELGEGTDRELRIELSPPR